jgi:uncharacterized membrane protein
MCSIELKSMYTYFAKLLHNGGVYENTIACKRGWIRSDCCCVGKDDAWRDPGLKNKLNAAVTFRSECWRPNLNRLIVLMFFGTAFSAFADPIDLATGNLVIINVPGALDTQAFGINNSGQISGFYLSGSSLADALQQGFILTNGTFSTIDVPGSAYTGVFGINDAGQVVGGYGATPTSVGQGFIYNGTSFSALDFPGAGSTMPVDINNVGQVVGAEYRPQTAFVANGSIFAAINVPPSSGCGYAQVAYGINDSGTIVGSCSNLSSFVLTGDVFSTFAFPDAFSTVALGIGDDGAIVGAYQLVQSTVNNSQGFVYQGGAFQTFDVPGAEATYVSGINDQNDLVGYFYDSSGVEHGFELIATPEPHDVALLLIVFTVGAGLIQRRASRRS